MKPELLYIRDKDGKLVPVPNMSLEDVTNYFHQKQKLDQPEQKPRYTLQQVTVSGTAEAERADLTVTIKILTTDTDWVRIPLRLNRCALRQGVEYKGGGDQILQYDPAGDGYVCWLRAQGQSQHELVLKMFAPLATTAGENRLELQAPRAAASELSLRVPTPHAVATVSTGAAPPQVSSDDKGSQITTLGLGPDFWLAWRAADQPSAQLSGALEAAGQMLVKIDGRSATTDATLTVRSFGAEFDHFKIRLPPGAELIGGQQSTAGYTLTPGAGADRSTVDVKLDRKTAGPVEIHLSTERAYDVTKAGEILDLAGFSVAEAIAHRQWGYIAVAVTGDWQLNWQDRNRVRQVDDLPEALKRRDVVAGFEYFGQPSSLQVRVQPRRTRVNVEPQYTFHVYPDHGELDAKLKYTVRGARLLKLDIDLAGWELDRVTPENLVDLDALVTGPGSRVSIPLAQPASGDFEINLQARRSLAGGSQIDWALPEPVADVLGPADVAIVAAPNVDLTPLADKIAGLTRVAGLLRPELREPGATVLAYRAEQPKARFVADFSSRAQAVTVDIDNRIALRLREVEINQSLSYQIRYEALDHLTLDVPKGAFDQHRVKFTVNGEPAEATEAAEQPSTTRRSVQVVLPRAVLGPLRVEAQTLLTQDNLLSGSGNAPLDIPLVVPQEGQVSGNVALVTSDPAIRVQPREGAWSVAPAPKGDSIAPVGLRLTATGPIDSIRLTESVDERRLQGATFIDRAWIQFWLTEHVRQDRALYSFTSTEQQLRLQLPAGIAPSDIELVLDGNPLKPLAAPSGSLAIALPGDNGRQQHLLELRYQFDGRGLSESWLTLETPRFESHVKLRRQYWQLALPADEHLVVADNSATPEYDWRWRPLGLGLERVPFKQEPQLEQWIGLDAFSVAEAGDETDRLPARTNQYLFSTAGTGIRLTVLVAREWLIVLIGSLLSLGLGLLIIYVPRLRTAPALAVALVVAAVAALVWPEPALLIVQAAAVGVALMPVAIWLRWLATRWRGAAPPPSSGLYATVDRSSKRVSFGSGRTAATTTAPIPVGAAGQGPTS